jgi:CRP-like cAMP-binding protein
MQLEDAATILSRADFFQICNAEQRRLLAFASERRRHPAGTAIYKSGEVAEGAHVLVSGTVTVSSEGPGEANPKIINTSGIVIGAMALFVAKPRPVTVKAVDSVETLFVPRTAFMKLAKQFPDMAARAAQRIQRDVVGYLGAVDRAGRRIAK